MTTTRRQIRIALSLVSFAGPAVGQTGIRIAEDKWVPGPSSAAHRAGADGALSAAVLDAPFRLTARAWHKQPGPGGGTLNPVAYGDGASIDASGALAFTTIIDGVPRNQGIFLANEEGLHPIAIGCGAGGGTGDPGTHCGDPTPIGGTFTGFFRGTYFIPAVVECMAGPADCPPQFSCTIFDFDGNGRVDLRDAAGFQGAFTGE